MMYRQLIPPVMIAMAFAISCSKEKEEARAPEQTMYPAALEEEQEGQTTMPASPAGMSAPVAISEARCEREMRCNNIGPDRKYSSQEDCLSKIRSDWQEELSARECPGGIDSAALTECLDAVRTEDCNAPFDSLERVVDCSAADICED